jgi:hypothetical protein
MAKFRAWDKEKRELVKDFIIDHLGNYYQTNKSEFWGDERNLEIIQSTDLQDRNGKEIFEGDYLEAKTNQGGFHRYEVRRVKGGLAINVFNDEFQKDFWTGWNAIADMQTSGFIEACCEVIGNKFEGMK